MENMINVVVSAEDYLRSAAKSRSLWESFSTGTPQSRWITYFETCTFPDLCEHLGTFSCLD